MKGAIIEFFGFLKIVRRRAGGTWYHILVWDEDYEFYGAYWTREKENEYEWFNSGRRIIKTECYE